MQILGQHHALEVLDRSLQSGRFHHAWIFAGPRGVGKFSTAMEVARVILDPESPGNLQGQLSDSYSPPSTNVQRRIDAGTHPDLHIIKKELAAYSENRDLRERKQMNIPINLLRELIIGGKMGPTYVDAPAYRTAQLGHGKVFILDEAEKLDEDGQNAMLKTLEEPPSQTYFFLITTQPDELLPTIRSRCQFVKFGTLDEQSLRHCAGDVKSDWVLNFAEGSPGVARLASEFGFEDWQRALDPWLTDLENGKFPTAMGDAMGGFVEDFAVAWVKKHGEKTSKGAANKDGARHMISLLSWHVRCKLAERAVAENDVAPWIAIADLLRQAEWQLESNVNMKLLMENLVVQWWHAINQSAMAAA